MKGRQFKKEFTLQQLKTNKKLVSEVYPTYSRYPNKIGEAFRLYINALIANDRSLNTIKMYHNHINELLDFLNTEYPKIDTPTKIKVKHVEKFLEHCQIYKGNSLQTIEHKTITITQFINFLAERKIISDNKKPLPERSVIKTIRRSKNKAPLFLDDIEIDDLFVAIENTPCRDKIKQLRDYCLYGLLISTGMRVSELTSLDVPQLYKLRRNKELRIIGKGDKERTIVVKDTAFETGYLRKFDAYLEIRKDYEKRVVRQKDKDALFLSREGTRLTSGSIQRNIKQYIKKAYLNDDISPHKLRHSFATALVRADVPLHVVQELLGHVDISTTSKYLHVQTKDRKSGVNKLGY